MRLIFVLLSLCLFACTSTPPPPSSVNNTAPDNVTGSAENEDVPKSDGIYYFQHQLLPKWTFNSEGEFFSDLHSGEIQFLEAVATDIVSSDYARELSVNVVDSHTVLITFPEPKTFPHCYYALVIQRESGYEYITYEKTMTLGDDAVVGVVGGWSAQGTHQNLGARTYSSAQDFVYDVTGKRIGNELLRFRE